MDWIVPLLIIGVSLYRWWTDLQKQQKEQGTTATERRPEVASPPRDEWSELLEALGQKPSTAPPPSTILIRPPAPSAPPPLPVLEDLTEEEMFEGMPKRHLESSQGPSWKQSTAFEKFEKRETFAELRASADEQIKAREKEFSRLEQELQASFIKTQTYSYSQDTAQSTRVPTSSYRFDRKSLRRAFVLKEILDPPLAMR